MAKSQLWGVSLIVNSRKEIYNTVNQQLTLVQPNALAIVTLNPEILLAAKEKPLYAEMLNKFNLKVIDGFGMKIAGIIKGFKTGDRVTGADLAEFIFRESLKRKLKVGIVYREDGLSSYSDLKRFFTQRNVTLFAWNSVRKNGLENIEDFYSWKPEVLLVGLGALSQEEFILKTKGKLPNLRLAIGIGGVFDFWTGRKKRAPKWMQKIGLEWLGRLFLLPKGKNSFKMQRIRKIWRSTGLFLFELLIDKLKFNSKA